MSKEQHSTLRHTMDKATDAVGGMVGRAEAQTAGSHSAAAFVENAAIGDKYEIEAARIALRRSRSAQIHEAARQMIADHTTSTHQLRSALRMNETKGVPHPPGSLDSRRQTMIEHLEKAPDGDFDSTYLDQQVLAHKETHDLMSGFAHGGDNPQLRSFALGTAPVVARHLKKMESLKASLRN